MTAPQSIEVEVHSANAAIVTLRGEHDLNTRPEVAKALSAASAYDNIVIDLSECSFLDSSVISALLQTSNKLNERDGLLRLVIAGDGHAGVRRLFEVMGLERVLPIHSSRAVAIAGLATRPPRTETTVARLRSLSELIVQSCDEGEDGHRAA
jgi:stage II sporulation protein AA (anti-sigma F factor antagonist)